MAHPRLIIFVLTALTIAGCASSTGSYVAVPGVPTAWDGDGARPDEGAVPRKKSVKRAKSTTAKAGRDIGSGAGSFADSHGEVAPPADVFAAEEAAHRDAEARLTKKLMICRGCGPAAGDDNISSAARR